MAAVFAAAAMACLSAARAEEPPGPGLYVLAQNDNNPFTSLVGRRGQGPDSTEVERYVTTDGDRAFLFESTANAARIKFLCAPQDPRVDCALPGRPEEILALTPNRGPRGDLFYKSAEGETLLRIAAHGGAIVVWPGSAENVGAVRTRSQPGDTLRLAFETISGAARRAEAATAALIADLGRPIRFDIGAGQASRNPLVRQTGLRADETAPALESESLDAEASVLADAIARTAAGIDNVARDKAGANAIRDRIAAVRFVESGRPALSLDGRTLVVSYNPGGGLAGRPSSSAVARFLEGAL